MPDPPCPGETPSKEVTWKNGVQDHRLPAPVSRPAARQGGDNGAAPGANGAASAAPGKDDDVIDAEYEEA